MGLGFFISSLGFTRTQTVEEPDALSAGPNQTVDSGDTVQLAANKPGIWTTSGTGTFDDSNLPNAVYTPSQHDIALGVITLTLTAGAESDSLELTFTVTQAYIATFVDRYWDSDDATDSAGNLTGWADRLASATMTNIGTPTVVTNQLNGHKVVKLNGTSSAHVLARFSFKSLMYVGKFYMNGSRLIHIPSSNTSTNFHAGVLGNSTLITVGMSGDTSRFDYTPPLALEFDADEADNPYMCYIFKNRLDFTRNMVKQYPMNETTTVDTSSTATNMFIGVLRRGDNTSTTSQWCRMSEAAWIMSDTEWTRDQCIILQRYAKARWAVGPSEATYKMPKTAEDRTTSALDTGHSSGGGAGNYYPAAVVKTDKYYIMAKATNNTGCMIESSDGDTWTEIAGGKITSTATSNFNGTYAYRDGSMVSDGTNYYCWFVARNNSAVEQIGLASTNDPDGTWTNHGLKLTVTAVNTALSSSYTGLGSPRIRRHPATNQYYLFVSAYDATGGDIVVCTMSAIDGGTITPIRKVLSRLLPYYRVYSSAIILKDNVFYMCTHQGHLETTRGERNVWWYESPTLDASGGEYKPFLTPQLEPRYNSSGVFDEGGVYDPEVLVENDGYWLTPQLINGKIEIFNAGVSWPVEVGLMGRFRVHADLFDTVTL